MHLSLVVKPHLFNQWHATVSQFFVANDIRQNTMIIQLMNSNMKSILKPRNIGLHEIYLSFLFTYIPLCDVEINQFRNRAESGKIPWSARVVGIQPEAPILVMDPHTGWTLFCLDAHCIQIAGIGRITNQKCADLNLSKQKSIIIILFQSHCFISRLNSTLSRLADLDVFQSCCSYQSEQKESSRRFHCFSTIRWSISICSLLLRLGVFKNINSN